MNQFIHQTNKFIDEELLPKLNILARNQCNKTYGIYEIAIKIEEISNISTHVKDIGIGVVEIAISRGWIYRLAFIYSILSKLSANHSIGPKVFTFDLEHPYESLLYENIEDNHSCLKLSPDLSPLLLDFADGDKQMELLLNFPEEVSIGGVVKMQISHDLSTDVKNSLLIWFAFSTYHEIAHIRLKHSNFISNWQYHHLGLDEISTVGSRINSYKLKAIEVDADCYAFIMLLDPFLKTGRVDDIEVVGDLFETVGIGLCCFDLRRRSYFDYRYKGEAYPAPDIRFTFIYKQCSDLLKSDFPALTKHFKSYYESAIASIVKAFQNLGVIYGPFHMLTGKLNSLSYTYLKEHMVCQAVESELEKIRIQFKNIRPGSAVNIEDKWVINPFALSEEEEQALKESELGRMFLNENSEDVSLIDRIRSMADQYQITPRDYMFVYQGASNKVNKSFSEGMTITNEPEEGFGEEFITCIRFKS